MIRTMEEFRKKYYPKNPYPERLTPKEIGRKLVEQSLNILRKELGLK